MQMVNDLLHALPPVLVYVIVAVLVAAESAIVAGLVLPAATALIALGLSANAGTVSIVPALIVAVGAAWFGGTVAYYSGRRLGPRIHTTRLGARIGAKRWGRAERLFTRYGGRAIFLGQWVVGARTLMPRLAAMNGVPYRRFAAWHTPAAALWAVWMVGASYTAGASYDVLAARAGHAGGALAVLVGLIVGLVLAGRWFGRHPGTVRAWGTLLLRFRLARALAGRRAPRLRWRRHPLAGPAVDVALSLGALFVLATLLVAVIPIVVRFSGLAAADASIAAWAQSEWTSDGYLFALTSARSASPEGLIVVAAVVSLIRWWWVWRRGNRSLRRDDTAGLLAALGPVVPMAVLAVVLAEILPPVWSARSFAPDGWRAPESVVFPPLAEFDGKVPVNDAVAALASMAASDTVQLAAAVGLLAWLLSRQLPWSWRVTVWTGAAVYVTVCAGSWVYLGWSRTSETVAALIVGVAWTALNAAIWSGRDEPAGTTASASSEEIKPAVGAAPGLADTADCPELTRTGRPNAV